MQNDEKWFLYLLIAGLAVVVALLGSFRFQEVQDFEMAQTRALQQATLGYPADRLNP